MARGRCRECCGRGALAFLAAARPDSKRRRAPAVTTGGIGCLAAATELPAVQGGAERRSEEEKKRGVEVEFFFSCFLPSRSLAVHFLVFSLCFRTFFPTGFFSPSFSFPSGINKWTGFPR